LPSALEQRDQMPALRQTKRERHPQHATAYDAPGL